MATLLITGAAGRIGTSLRGRLRAVGHDLVLLDRRDPEPKPGAGERFVRAGLDDRDALSAAMVGVDTVVHLAGIPTEAPWDDIVATNMTGTRNVLECALDAGIRRVVQASSVHAVGRVPEPDEAGVVPGDLPARPDTYYGVSKAVMELLGGLFADRFGMTIVSARIGAFGEQPSTRRALRLWTSADDFARFVLAAHDLDAPGHQVAWAVSRNRDTPADLGAGARIGFHPVDDAGAVLGEAEVAGLPSEDMRFLGGALADVPLNGEPPAS